jgi:hypothetical protein
MVPEVTPTLEYVEFVLYVSRSENKILLLVFHGKSGHKEIDGLLIITSSLNDGNALTVAPAPTLIL